MKNGEKKMRIKDRLETILKAAIDSEAENLKEINDVLNLIIKKQDKLNKELAGEDYAKTLTTTAGLPINYGDCIMSETDEIQNSIPWKHWKAGSFNKANLNTEIFDLFHFAPSVLLTAIANSSELESAEYVDFYINSDTLEKHRDMLLNFCKDELTLYTFLKNNIATLGVNLSSVYLVHKIGHPLDTVRLIQMALGTLKNALLIYMINNEITDAKVAINEIYKSYLVKNVLNSFRNDNGYKEGTYLKMWRISEDEEKEYEDNDIAYGIASVATDISADELEEHLLAKLTEKYSKAMDYYRSEGN